MTTPPDARNALAELLPCPFCGSERHMNLSPTCDRTTPYNPHDRAFPIIRCLGCFTDVPGENFDATGKSASAAWNRRASDARIAALEAQVEGMREAEGRLMSNEQIIAHVENYSVKEGDPRRRYTFAQLDTAIRLARKTTSPARAALQSSETTGEK